MYTYSLLKVVSKTICLFLLIFSGLFSAQQNEEFKSVKEHFDYQRYLLANEFKKHSQSRDASIDKKELNLQFSEFMIKLDSIQNSAYIGALIKVKNREDLSVLSQNKINNTKQIAPVEEVETSMPNYPGGIGVLRKEVADLFYFDANISDQKEIKTKVTFVVERDGNISSVAAEGDDSNFNRQAMIAIYLLPNKFTPAKINGSPVRYHFTLPLTMNFE